VEIAAKKKIAQYEAGWKVKTNMLGRLKQPSWQRDIDQTDFHRSEPSSRTLLWDEHSDQ